MVAAGLPVACGFTARMGDDDRMPPPPVADRYGRFARDEAPGRSALYAEWAAGVAADRAMAAILARIPATHRQPPLVFAVTRLLGAPEGPYREWAAWLAAHADAVVAECSRRSLQTNEPLRCAALLPALSGIDGPIALLELGASAGLCLYPDRYSYRYRGGADLDPADGPSTVVLQCDGHRRSAAADARRRVARGHRPRSARCRGCRTTAASSRPWCGRGRRGARRGSRRRSTSPPPTRRS